MQIRLSKKQHQWLADERMHRMGYDQPDDEWNGLWLEVQAGRDITELESLEDLCGSGVDRWEFGDRDEYASRERGYGLRIIEKIREAERKRHGAGPGDA